MDFIKRGTLRLRLTKIERLCPERSDITVIPASRRNKLGIE